MYGINSNETRRKYVAKLEQFFDFYKIEGETIEEKSENFLQYTRKGKDISQKVTDLVLNYMYFHIQRAQKNEIALQQAVRAKGLSSLSKQEKNWIELVLCNLKAVT